MRTPGPHVSLVIGAVCFTLSCFAACRHERAASAPEIPSPPAESASPATHENDSPKPALSAAHGRAAYYSDALRGRNTASGEPYDPVKLTAAHRTLPFGTVVRVARVDTGASVEVRINDRGPFGDEIRIIDLSRSAAEKLDMRRAGVVDVRVEILSGAD